MIRSSERFIRQAIDENILKPVDRKRARDMARPCIALACGDLSQAKDRLTHLWDRFTPHAQLIMLHGGGLLLDPISPANQPHSSIPEIRHQIGIGVAAKAKKGITIDLFAAYYDYPCGVAEGHSMSARDTFQAAIHGKNFAKTDLVPGWEMALLFSIYDLRFLADHRCVQEHPMAEGLTFYFGAKDMTLYLNDWKDSVEEPAVA